MLTKFDDYPIHQTPEPLAEPATTDRNVYDRYWFNGYDRDGEFYFGVGMAVYPHRGILDCAFSIVRDGEQHSFHASRRAPAERGETVCGPFTLEVVEPMREIRVRVEPNETGIECDLRFRARTAPVEEGRQTMRNPDGRIIMDATRFAQWGTWEGSVGYDGNTVHVAAERTPGTKDRSWGIRPSGEPETGGAPATGIPGVFFLWAPIHWEDHCTHFGIFEHADGRRWYEEGMIVPAYGKPSIIPGPVDPAQRNATVLDYSLNYRSGTRHAAGATIELAFGPDDRRVIELEPLLKFQMKGLGYTSTEWIQGAWKGELAVGSEYWRVGDLDPLAFDNLHVQQVMRARCGNAVGVGVLEQLAIGPHVPSGFAELLDGAP